jgi:hypothetical protein
MLLLSGANDKFQLTTSSTAAIDVFAAYVDLNASVVTPGRQATAIVTATTTDIVGAVGASQFRTVKFMSIRNKNTTTTNTVTVLYFNGSTAYEIIKVSLLAGEMLHYDANNGWTVRDEVGRIKLRDDQILTPATPAVSTTVLNADVTNNNATLNTMQDVTGLSFAVVAAATYMFRFLIPYTAAVTTTGSRWSINGPAAPTLLMFRSEYSLTTTTRTINEGLSAYDTPAASNATAATTGSNIAIVEGIITPSVDGTVIARFASEIASSAVIAKAGALVHYQRTRN